MITQTGNLFNVLQNIKFLKISIVAHFVHPYQFLRKKLLNSQRRSCNFHQ